MASVQSLSGYTRESVSIKFKSKRRAIGDLGEAIASIYFEKIGWHILEKNWKLYRAPELDFILISSCKTMVFLEVKARSFNGISIQDFESCIDSIHMKKQKNMIKAAKIFTRQSPLIKMRFDVLAISILEYSIETGCIEEQIISVMPENVKFLHIESAFLPQG